MSPARARWGRPWAAIAALALAACLRAASGAPSVDQAAKLLGTSRTSVEQLEASVAALQARLSGAERAIVSAAEETTVAGRGLLRVAATRELPALTQRGADLNATVESELTKLDLATSQAQDLLNASAQVALRAEQLIGDGEIKSRHGICLDAAERGTNGGQVRMWTCLRGVKNQQWYYNAQTGSIRNLHGICLDAPDGSNTVLMWTCDRTLGSQQWTYEADTGLVRSGRAGGVCLGSEQPTLKGGGLSLSPCNPDLEGQQWSLVAGASGAVQTLEVLNKEIWDVADPRSPNSVDANERQADRTEAVMNDFEGRLGGRVRGVLAKRLLPGANGMRHALRHLAKAASSQPPSPGATDAGEPPLGAELGLDG